MSRKVARRTRELAHAIAKMLDEGERPIQIGLALGVSPSCVRRTAKRFGLALPPASLRRIGCFIPERHAAVMKTLAERADVAPSVMARRILVSVLEGGADRATRHLGKDAGARRRGKVQ